MKVEEMRIGGRYMLDDDLVECVSLSREIHGQCSPHAAYRGERDWFVWRRCDEYRHPTSADMAALIRRDYTIRGK